ncbi:hypothetical protein BB559_005574, partial [Furculomyces boomerangus]
MKYSKYIQNNEHNFPLEWRSHLFPYKLLKKDINKITEDLETKNFNQLPSENAPESPLLNDSQILNTSDSNKSKKYPKTEPPNTFVESTPICELKDENGENLQAIVIDRDIIMEIKSQTLFFRQISKVLNEIETFEKDVENELFLKLEELSSDLLSVTSPFDKDLGTWRNIFSIYLDSTFFEKNNRKHLTIDWVNSANNAHKRFTKTVGKFKSPKSVSVYKSFDKINKVIILLAFMGQMNYTATRKIIKKHDRRTGIRTKENYLKTMLSRESGLTLALISQLSNQFVSILPMIEDYECPVCFSVLINPIRLRCLHLICSHCMLYSRLNGNHDCPLCRHQNALLDASNADIDQALKNMLKLYFPKEIRNRRNEI